jgi:O-antigen ligase
MFKSLTLPSKTLLLGVVLIVLTANPNTYDPFNVTRFLILVVFASILFLLIGVKNFRELLIDFRLIGILALLFCLQLFLVLLFSQANKDQQLFGVFGRNLGFITYLSFIIIFLATIQITTKEFMVSLYYVVIFAGAISLSYSIIQWQNLDPIPWINPYSPIVGFFGNPNFNSAFLGMTAGSLITMLLNKNKKIKIYSICYIAIALFLILMSKSIQGFLVFGLSALVFLTTISFKINIIRKYRFLVTGFSSGIIALVILDILQKLPWGSLLYKGSVSQRGDLWRGAWQMGKTHPIFGVGLDSYIDFHYRSRDALAASHGWVNELSNDAHNVFLNLLATGGFPLFIIYILIFVYTFTCAIKVVRRMDVLDLKFIAIFLLWIGYFAQSIISINHIALASLGWVLSGAIVGYEKHTRTENESKKLLLRKKLKSQDIIKILSGLIVGLFIGISPLLSDMKMYTALSTGKIELMKNVTDYYPKNVTYLNVVAEIFEKNKLYSESLIVARYCVEKFPNSGFAWSVIYRSPLVSEVDRELAKAKLLEINPYAKFDN